MSFLELWRIFRRRWWIVVLVTVVAAGSALVYSQRQPVTYRAQAEVVVLPSRADWNLSMYLEARMRVFRAVLLSRPLAGQALAQLALERPPDDLLAHTHVQLDPEEGRIVIEVSDGDPQTAADLANALAGLLEQWVDEFNATQVGLDRIYVRTLTPAQPPGASAGPRTQVNAVAGAVLGFVVSLPLAFLWDWLDDTVRDPKRAADRLAVTVWPPIAPFPPDEVVPLEEPEGQVAAAFHHLYAYLRFSEAIVRADQREAEPPPAWRTLAIAGITPEDLPPALPADLAVVIAQGGSTVLLIDADFHRPALHGALDLPPSPSLGDFLQRGDQGALKPAGTPQAGLYLLPAGAPRSPAAQAANLRRMARQLAPLRQAAEVVLIRIPSPLEAPEGLFLAAQVDAVLLAGRVGRVRYRDLRRTLDQIDRAGAAVLGLALWRPQRGR